MTADEIRAIRKATGLTQAAFARAYRLNKRTLERWEVGGVEKLDQQTETLLGMIRADHDLAALLIRKAFPEPTNQY